MFLSGAKVPFASDSILLSYNDLNDVHIRTSLFTRQLVATLTRDNSNIYFAKGQVDQKGKSLSKLATILRATKVKKQKQKRTTLQTFRVQ